MGYPLVMKLLSPDISPKTEAGGVRLDLHSDADVRAAFARIAASAPRYKPDVRIDGVTLQPYFANPDYEILLGAKRDTSLFDRSAFISTFPLFSGGKPLPWTAARKAFIPGKYQKYYVLLYITTVSHYSLSSPFRLSWRLKEDGSCPE